MHTRFDESKIRCEQNKDPMFHSCYHCNHYKNNCKKLTLKLKVRKTGWSCNDYTTCETWIPKVTHEAFIKLIDELFEVISHGDFSNRNVVQFVDEGQATASIYIEKLREEYNGLKRRIKDK